MPPSYLSPLPFTRLYFSIQHIHPFFPPNWGQTPMDFRMRRFKRRTSIEVKPQQTMQPKAKQKQRRPSWRPRWGFSVLGPPALGMKPKKTHFFLTRFLKPAGFFFGSQRKEIYSKSVASFRGFLGCCPRVRARTRPQTSVAAGHWEKHLPQLVLSFDYFNTEKWAKCEGNVLKSQILVVNFGVAHSFLLAPGLTLCYWCLVPQNQATR